MTQNFLCVNLVSGGIRWLRLEALALRGSEGMAEMVKQRLAKLSR